MQLNSIDNNLSALCLPKISLTWEIVDIHPFQLVIFFFFLLYPFCSPIIPMFLISNKINHRFNYTIKSYCRYGAGKKRGLKTIVVRHLIACKKESIFIRLWTHFSLEKSTTSLFIKLEIMCECDSSENTSTQK